MSPTATPSAVTDTPRGSCERPHRSRRPSPAQFANHRIRPAPPGGHPGCCLRAALQRRVERVAKSARRAIARPETDADLTRDSLTTPPAPRAAEYTRALRHLAEAGVTFCLLRNRPEDARPDADLDLLIAPADRERACAAFAAAGFVLRRGAGAPLKAVFVRYYRGTLLTLDVHWAMVQQGFRYADESVVLARRRGPDVAPRLSPEDELIHLVAYELIRRDPPKPARRARVVELLGGELNRTYLEERVAAFGYLDVFLGACEWLRDRCDPTTHARLRSRLKWALIRADPRNAARGAAFRMRPILRARRRGGVIALVGPDGAGKSTVLRAVPARGAGMRSPRLESVYLGPWGQNETGLLSLVRRLGLIPSREPWGRRVAEMDARLPLTLLKWVRSELKALVFYPATLAELWWRYLRSVAPRTQGGAWVVADRYITDLRYLYKGDLMPNYRLLRAAVCALYPTPSLFVLVDQTPETIHERKPGLSLEQIRAFQEAYHRALRGKPWMQIRTDGTPEEAADRVLDATVRLWAGERAPIGGGTPA